MQIYRELRPDQNEDYHDQMVVIGRIPPIMVAPLEAMLKKYCIPYTYAVDIE